MSGRYIDRAAIERSRTVAHNGECLTSNCCWRDAMKYEFNITVYVHNNNANNYNFNTFAYYNYDNVLPLNRFSVLENKQIIIY